ncbi:tRNA-dihydrouridine synthase 2 [Lecanora helva]
MANTPKLVPIPKNGVDYRGKIVLAPMVRSGELPSRLLALKYGADLAWGPETVDKSMIGTTKRFNPITSTIDFTRFPSNNSSRVQQPQKESLIYRLHPTRERGKLIFQIGTAAPETAVAAAKLVAEDVAGIDVNAGCPKPFSTSGGMGAALLQDPDRLASILVALVKEVGEVYEIGISVKIRLLETPERTEALVRKLCSTGITGLTIHCRTTPMRPRERAIRDQLRMIANICREEGVACLMNGDVRNRDEALQLVEEYCVDGAMIATAAEANSSCFRTQEEGGLLSWKEIVTEYMKTALEVDNKWGNTKFLLSQLMPGKAEVSKRVVGCHSYRQVCEVLELNDMVELAREVDGRLGLDEDKETKAMKKAKRQNQSAQAAGGHLGKQRSVKKKKRHSLAERGVGAPPMMPAMTV